MIAKLLLRSSTLGLMLAVIFAGSFVLMEESLEKTERAEGEKEAIHVQFHTAQARIQSNTQNTQRPRPLTCCTENSHSRQPVLNGTNFHIDFIYLTSFLRS